MTRSILVQTTSEIISEVAFILKNLPSLMVESNNNILIDIQKLNRDPINPLSAALFFEVIEEYKLVDNENMSELKFLHLTLQ